MSPQLRNHNLESIDLIPSQPANAYGGGIENKNPEMKKISD